MSTTINVTVGNAGLKEKAKQQTNANRQAKLEADARAKAEAEGKRQRDIERAKQGLTPDGDALYGVPTRPQKRKEEPAASRETGTTIVGGVGVKVTYFTTSGTTRDWTVRLSIGGFKGAAASEFTIPCESQDWDAAAPASGLPTTWSAVPVVLGSYSAVQQTLVTNSSNIFAGGVDPNISYSIARDLTNLEISANLSKTVVLPDGKGGAYVVFILNRLHKKWVDRVTKTVSNSLTLRSQRRVVLSPQPDPVFQPYKYYVEWSTNPGCYSATTSDLPTQQDIDNYNATASRYWAGINTISSVRTTVLSNQIKHYEVKLYRVNGATVTEISTPAALRAWMEQLYPPVDFNTETVVTPPAGSVAEDANFTTPGSVVWRNSWDGSHISGGTGNCLPNIQAFDARDPLTNQNWTYQSFSSATYYANTTAINVSEQNLLFLLGGVSINGYNARGPSFAYAYGKNIKALTSSQLLDYAYMEETFLGVKPRTYAASCVLSGQCSPFSQYELDWASTTSRPTTYGQLAPLGTYSVLKEETTTVPTHLISGYTLYYFTNWGSSSLCRRALSPLGL